MAEFRIKLSKKQHLAWELIGAGLILLIWVIITSLKLVPSAILPSPMKILSSLPELHYEDALIRNVLYSFKLNLLGFLEAVIFALPVGFIIGLYSEVRAMFEKYISAIRFLPLTAVVGLFVAWFGIYTNMKVQFLAFSIFIFLLPVIIQRMDEVDDVFIQTAKTLGATKFQIVKYVYIPAVLSKVFDDIRVLAALSWTYIIVAELVNSSGGGVGALSYIASRQGRTDKIFAILLTIILIGVLQDKFLKWADRKIFPHKYARS